jgi:hypothetical protein
VFGGLASVLVYELLKIVPGHLGDLWCGMFVGMVERVVPRERRETIFENKNVCFKFEIKIRKFAKWLIVAPAF